jgi:Uri superfamily endonuclease
MNGIEGRIKRHLRDEKKVHWHIDYLLKEADVFGVYYQESKRKQECDIAKRFENEFEIISKFGSSDCQCGGHLFKGGKEKLKEKMTNSQMTRFYF